MNYDIPKNMTDEDDIKTFKMLVEKKEKMLETYGVLLYKPINNRDYFRTIRVAKQIDYMQEARINSGINKLILIRVYRDNIANVSPENLKMEADYDYSIRHYTEALKKRLSALSYEKNVPLKEYIDIGNCYLKLRNYGNANKYYTIAKSIALDFGIDIEVPELFEAPKVMPIINRTEANKITLNDSTKELIIIDVVDNHDDINRTLENYNLSEEDKQIALIEIAKEYYRRNFEKMGDKVLKMVDHISNKTDKTIKLLNYVRSNKKLIIKQK